MPRKKKETVETQPMPTGEDNQAMKDTLAGIREKIDSEPKKKRHRRTKAEIEAERIAAESSFDDTGWEGIADLILAISDNDHKKYGLPKCKQSDFESISKQYCKVFNYFFKRYGKPIYFVCMGATVQSVMMLRTRSQMINAAIQENEPVPEPTPEAHTPKTKTGFPNVSDVKDSQGYKAT